METDKKKFDNRYSVIAVQNIKIVLNARGIPVSKVEKEIGVSVGYFSRVDSEGRALTFDVMIRACKYLGVSVDDVIKDDLIKEIEEHKAAIDNCVSRIEERFTQEGAHV